MDIYIDIHTNKYSQVLFVFCTALKPISMLKGPFFAGGGWGWGGEEGTFFAGFSGYEGKCSGEDGGNKHLYTSTARTATTKSPVSK